MMKHELIAKLCEYKTMAIIRTDSLEKAKTICKCCIEGRLPVVEISYTFNNASDIIKNLKLEYKDDLICGAGTVLDSITARIAILSGAQFIISPNFDKEVALMCNRYDIPYMPGVSSMSEAVDALSYGASFIKAFPISNFYKEDLVSVFKTPLPNIKILASGGVNLSNLKNWLEKGIDICGFGSLFTKGSEEEILNNIKKVKQIIEETV